MIDAMGVRAKFVLMVSLLITAIILILGGFQWYRYAQDLESQFIRESISNANVLADLLRRYIQESPYDVAQLQEVLMMEGKFYAEIVKDEKLLFVSGDNSLIRDSAEPKQFSERLWLEKKFLPNGTPYLDIKRVLDLVTDNESKKTTKTSYLRLGYSMAQLSGQINAQLWQNVWIGLVILCIVSLSVYFLAKAWFDEPKQETTLTNTMNSGNEAKKNLEETSRMPAEGVLLRVGLLEINEKNKQVRRAGQLVTISPREFSLLRLLASDPERVFSNEEILRQAWGENSYMTSEDVKKYVYQLRQKLESDPENPKLIITIRGFGYKISVH
jgi:DNA-binding response OmpR family regulator